MVKAVETRFRTDGTMTNKAFLSVSPSRLLKGWPLTFPPFASVNHDDVVNNAHSHAGGSAESGLFASAMNHLSNNSVRPVLLIFSIAY